MRTTRIITLAALALAMTSITAPALAQSGGNDGARRARDRETRATQSNSQDRQARGGEAVRREAPNAGAARASGSGDRVAATAPRASGSGDRGAAVQGGGDRASATRSYATSSDRTRGTEQNRSSAPSTATRSYAQSRPNAGGYDNRQTDNRANGNRAYDNRGYNTRGYDNRSYGYGGYGYGGYDWNSYGWHGTYDRNAWRNRVHYGLGFSIFAGSPFSFRFSYGWQPSFRYRYSVMAGTAYGGMSFLLDPDFAEVYIDGEFVGVARDFGGQPVPVPAGYHRVELYAQGFEPVAFDIDVRPGQVIPYRGTLYQVY